ncbi:hypothetical protein [Methanobrevibacter curvatus]|uniref:Uncharacterized protein n=1 Tax=Methanobrevibacter curvatus TaxID=49547 RepID=A0A162FJW6_9EURY|nr:hypothetical protein [Methanobrevibacter curvatus]KZX11110.1 hypothetical protein MBCUR_15450 [Methanobrevibacter curvatus]
MVETINFNYSFSKLGNVNVRLYEFTSQCYILLEQNNKFNHIKRLKEIDQLGVIRNVHEGTHHPRWEYVVLQLNIINQLCSLEIAKGLGLKTNQKSFKKFKPSGGDILQMWVLMFNSGHLPGTFASERGFLKLLLKNKKFKKVFYDGIKCKTNKLTKSKRKFFKEILGNEDIYSVHKILISFLLNRYKRSNLEGIEDTDEFIDFLQEVHDFYFTKQKESEIEVKRIKLISLFRRIRQISYLFLDSQYAPIPLSFDLPLVFFNFEEYYNEIFINPESQIVKTLDSFDDLLSTSFYHSKHSISELGIHSKNIYKKLEKKDLSKMGTVEEHLYSKDTFLPNRKYNKHTIFQIFFDISIDKDLFSIFKKYLSFDEEKKWNKKFGKSYCILTFQSSPSKKLFVINIKFENEGNFEKNFKILGMVIKQLVELYEKLKNEIPNKKELLKSIFKKPFEYLTIDILKVITKDKLYFEFDDKYYKYNILPSSGASNASKELSNIFQGQNDLFCSNNEFKRVHKHRCNEIKSLIGILKEIDHTGKLLVAMNPILVYDENRNLITDFDGFAIGFYREELKILLIQAKYQKKALRDAFKQMEQNLQKIEFITSKNEEIIRNIKIVVFA